MAFSTQEYKAALLKIAARYNGSVSEANALIKKMNKEKPDGYKALVKELKHQVRDAKLVIPKKNW